jgi:organic radical activating enzyme
VGYEVNAGRIDTWSLEAHIVDHCNLRCAECCTLSPHLDERFTSPAELRRDLTRAATALRPHVFKITGGEPLLHPEIVPILEAARVSGISRVISVTTNGTFAPRMPPTFWRLIDRMTLSLYESAPLPDKSVAAIRERCEEHGVRLTIKPYLGFQRMTPENDDGHDEARAREIHKGCWLRVRCHLVHRGRFYTCTRPPHLSAVLGRDLAAEDGVELDGDDLLPRVLHYLERDEPSGSCRHCLGATGAREPHRQLVPIRVRQVR